MTATAALRSGQQSALWPKGAAVLLSIALSWIVAPARAGSFDADDATGKALISHLDSDNWKYRIEALEEIGDRGLIQAVDKVVQLARSDEHHKVRHDALEVLEEVESSWLLPTAEFMVVEDPVEHNRKDALEVLYERGEGSRTAMVLGKVILGDHLSDLRERAARVLRKKKWTGAEEALARAALRDGESDVRRECRRAL
mgnify:CR=1 FL=1